MDEAIEDVGCVVGGLVVVDEEFEGDVVWELLVEDGAEDLFDVCLFVAGWDADGEVDGLWGLIGGCGFGLCFEEWEVDGGHDDGGE